MLSKLTSPVPLDINKRPHALNAQIPVTGCSIKFAWADKIVFDAFGSTSNDWLHSTVSLSHHDKQIPYSVQILFPEMGLRSQKHKHVHVKKALTVGCELKIATKRTNGQSYPECMLVYPLKKSNKLVGKKCITNIILKTFTLSISRFWRKLVSR